jgi:phage terminase small subunit
MPAGRRKQPISILKQNGKKHLTKKEIADREVSEVKAGVKTLTCPEEVKSDAVAYKKWLEILRVFKQTDLISSGDVGMLSRYCVTYSSYIGLLERKNKLVSFRANWREFKDVLPIDFQQAIEDVFKFDAFLQLETAINKKLDQLLKMEDRSFLNPLAKIKGRPKQEPKPERTPLEEKGFGNV